MKKKLIIFDKDGTLMDFDGFWVKVTECAITELFNKLKIDYDVSLVLHALGLKNGVTSIDGVLCYGTYAQIADVVLSKLSEKSYFLNKDIFYNQIVDCYHNNLDKGLILPTSNKLRDTLLTLKNNGVILCVVTTDNPTITEKCLNALGINDCFEIVLSDDGVMPAKPNPYCINYLCEKFNLSKTDVLMVGDTINDVKFAKNGEIECFALAKSQSNKLLLENYADLVIDDISDLLRVVE